MSDPELLDRKERFRAVYDRTYDDLWAYTHRRATAQDAADVVSETFAIAWQRLDDLPPPPNTRPWLFGVARNLLRTHYRKSGRAEALDQRLRSELLAGAAVENPDADDDFAGQLDQALVAMASLKEIDQEIIRLTAWEELSHAEIAEMLDMKEKAVTVRLHRARIKLETAMVNGSKPTSVSSFQRSRPSKRPKRRQTRENSFAIVKPTLASTQVDVDGNIGTETKEGERR